MLTGKTAVITGGSRGIGLAIARRFLANHAAVAVCGSRQETADAAVAKLREEFPDGKMVALSPDLMDYDAVRRSLDAVKAQFGSLDIMVNNAGVSARDKLYEYDPADFQRTVNLNVTSVFIGAKAAAELMREQGGGVILNTSSMVSIYGQSAGCGYPASKFAVNGLTKSLARELGPDNIRVNAVAPGVTETDMVSALPKEVIQPIMDRIPLKRAGRPEEVADAFLFLASDLASYITGVVLSVDGAAMS